jgi:UDP-N-acetylglucosamine 2-epimerase (non-hydrolysing)
MKKILIIFGTRPEAIKLAPVILELRKYQEVQTQVCVTAQHRQMLDQVLSLFDVGPDRDLDIMSPDQTLADITARVVSRIDDILKEDRPDVVLVQGDTTTVMAASLAAFYNKVPVGHVEAGLRSHNLYSPFPEEMNRRITSMATLYHFAPTSRAREALLDEGISVDRIHVTGNTVIDALQFIVNKPIPISVAELIGNHNIGTSGCGKKMILVTAHRRENHGERFESICRGLRALAERNVDIVIVYPVHMNPNVRETVFHILRGHERIILIDPVEYDAMAHLMNFSTIILTDSGGVQEEAPSLGKPVLVMRTETERPEGIDAGTAKLIGPFEDRIIEETERLLFDDAAYREMAVATSPYGDGTAAKRIANILLKDD